MNIVQITPGAGGMYCGNCFRDNALVAALRRMGHHTLMVPLYLPLTLDEHDESAGTPIFFSGINVYLDQKSAFFRHAPNWLHRLLASPTLLQWAADRTAKTRPEDVGDLMLSMLRGEQGHQARELDELIGWLQHQAKPEVVCLSNALLIGLVREIRARLGVPVACMLQGEDSFLDSMPASHRQAAWDLLRERAKDVDFFIAPSGYFADRMGARLNLARAKIHVVPNGINLEGFGRENPRAHATDSNQAPPVIGYFARMCREKGLHTLVDAFVHLKQRSDLRRTRLHVGGGCGPADLEFVAELKQRLAAAHLLDDVQFFPNVDRAGKLDFLHSLTVFSVPANFGEAFGLYLIEALAAGVPVVQPRAAAFPELLAATGGGVLCEPDNPQALSDGLADLLLDSRRARQLAARGQQAVRAKFGVEHMARGIADLFARQLARG